MRTLGILFGVGTHVLFGLTVCRLFLFLRGDNATLGLFSGQATFVPDGVCLDGLLALQFGVVHSWLLLPRTRQRLERWVPAAHYGCFFCVATCLSLLLAIEGWQPGLGTVWRLSGVPARALRTAGLLTWGGLVYSLSLTGLGYQTGWTPWWAWVRGRKPPRRAFQPRGAYHVLRHPVYLSFLGLVWLTPVLTLDRVVLMVVWTMYILVGSYLKDGRLLSYVGDAYCAYQGRVPGYPFVFFGPLARGPLPQASPALDKIFPNGVLRPQGELVRAA
jgi:methanethiol S-methyltransferase